MVNTYAFTLKYNSMDIHPYYLPDLYAKYIEHITKHFCHLSNWTWEYDSQHKLHVHAIISMRPSKTPRMISYKPFHINYSLLRQPSKWISYLLKSPEQIQLNNTNLTLTYDPKWSHQQTILELVQYYRTLSLAYNENLEGINANPEVAHEIPAPGVVSNPSKPGS